MAEFLLPKQIMRVRFPLPAPKKGPGAFAPGPFLFPLQEFPSFASLFG